MPEWIKDRPQAAGVYWLELEGNLEMLRVFQHLDEWVYVELDREEMYSVEAVPGNARWAGPIEPPV